MKNPIILGSSSPRRLEILNLFTLPFIQIFPMFDEESIPFTGDAGAYTQLLSQHKAASLAVLHPKRIILTADTTVSKGNKIYNKPITNDEAFRQLTELSGERHTIFTGMTLYNDGTFYSYLDTCNIVLKKLSALNIALYHAKVFCLDKAGSYAIQEQGEILVDHMEGCYSTAKGLSIKGLEILFSKIGINLWEHLKRSP